MYISKKVIYIHTEKFYSIPWFCNMNFNNFYLTLLFITSQLEETGIKEEKEKTHLKNAVYTNYSTLNTSTGREK